MNIPQWMRIAAFLLNSPSTTRQISRNFNICVETVYEYLNKMEDAGLLEYDDNLPRKAIIHQDVALSCALIIEVAERWN